MKETRVQKYQQYRKSIAKENSKGFNAHSKEEKVSPEAGLFLKIQKRKKVENIVMIATMVAVSTLIITFGFVLF